MVYPQSFVKDLNIWEDSDDHAYDFTEWNSRAYIVYLTTTAVVISTKNMWKETVLHNVAAWRSEGTTIIKFQADNGGYVKIKGIIGLRPVDMVLEDM